MSNKAFNNIPNFTNFINHRNPSLNVGMAPNPIPNMTVLPNQLHRSLDLLAQTDQLTVSNRNKNLNLDDSNIVASNEIIDPIDTTLGIGKPFIPYDEQPKPDAYFNNFANEGRTDIIREYICHINSIDRDIKKYPSPFHFLVKCAPLAGDPNAAISRTFSNIRYLKIETAVLPRRYYVVKKSIDINTLDPNLEYEFRSYYPYNLPSDNTIINNKWIIIYAVINNNYIINFTLYEPDISKPINITYEYIFNLSTFTTETFQYEQSNISLENNKYTIVYLNDINDVSQFSTDIALSKAFNVLYPDLSYGDTLYVDCRYADKIYKYSELGNINRLELTLADPLGKELTINLKSQDYNVPNINITTCTCSTDANGNTIRDYKCVCTYIRHPRFIKYQIDIMFKFGIVETDFDKRAFA